MSERKCEACQQPLPETPIYRYPSFPDGAKVRNRYYSNDLFVVPTAFIDASLRAHQFYPPMPEEINVISVVSGMPYIFRREDLSIAHGVIRITNRDACESF